MRALPQAGYGSGSVFKAHVPMIFGILCASAT